MPTTLKRDAQQIRHHLQRMRDICDRIDVAAYQSPAPLGPPGRRQRKAERAAFHALEYEALLLVTFIRDAGGRLLREHNHHWYGGAVLLNGDAPERMRTGESSYRD